MVSSIFRIDDVFEFVFVLNAFVRDFQVSCFGHDFSYHSGVSFPLLLSLLLVVFEEIVVGSEDWQLLDAALAVEA